MGFFRFRRRFKIAPGLHVSFGKKSVGLSIGGRGAHLNVSSARKPSATVGVPGTGLSYTSQVNGVDQSDEEQTAAPPAANSSCCGWFGCTGLLGCLVCAWLLLHMVLVLPYCGLFRK